MKKTTKQYSSKSQILTAKYLNGDEKITLSDIKRQEVRDRFNYLLDRWSLSKEQLKPLIFLPVAVYFFFLD